MTEELKRAIVEYLDTHRHCVLATARADGSPQASTVSYVNEGLTIYFMTDPSSAKARNIEFCPKVGMAISEDYLDWDEIRAVQLAGDVDWIADQEELGRVQKMFAARFPQVHKYLDGYGVTIDVIPFLRVSPRIVNYLDYSKGFNHWDTVEL